MMMYSKDLIESIITAHAYMEEQGIRPTVIVLNEHKYSVLRNTKDRVLAIFGMEVIHADLPDNYDFYIPSERW